MKEKLAGLIFDIPYQDLSGYQVEKVEAINQLLIEARIEALEPFTDNRITMASSLRRYADKQIAELQQSIKDKDE